MPPPIVITATVTETVSEILDRMVLRLESGSLEEFLTRIMDPFVRERIKERFDNEGDDASGIWEPLKPQTAKIRAAAGFPAYHPINVRTGQMEAFLLQASDVHGAGADGAWMQWPGNYTDQEIIEKVRTAQSGKADPLTPPRPVLGFNIADEVFLATELVKHMLGITATIPMEI